MPATIEVEFTDASAVLEEAAAADAQIARQFGATAHEAFAIGEREGVTRAAREALGGVTATPARVAAFVAAVECGDTGATLALLASR
jgi:hypothetical protein